MFPSSGRFIGSGHGAPRGGVVLCIHDQSAFLPVQLAEVFLTGSFAVEARRVDFSMAVLLEYVDDGGAGGKGVHAGLLGAWLAEGHGAKDDVEGWGVRVGHLGMNFGILVSGLGFNRTGNVWTIGLDHNQFFGMAQPRYEPDHAATHALVHSLAEDASS